MDDVTKIVNLNLDLDEDFQVQATSLFEKYTAPGKFLIKRDSDGNEMTCDQLYKYLEIFASLIKKGMEVNDVQSFIQV